jgi:hypothetical protein
MFDRFLLLPLALGLSITDVRAQSLAGIKLGGNAATVLEKITLEPIAREGQGGIKIVKYRQVNGNELSVTYNNRSNRILYIENDWCLKPEGAITDVPSFEFGVTTLEEIRRINGSNGFSWSRTAMNKTADQIIAFNAYDIKSKPNQIAVFVTSLSLSEAKNKLTDPSRVAQFFKLRAIILAEEDYLDEIWGEEKTYDKKSKPISWY